MPRPAQFTVDDLLDAAAQVLADGGPAAVTMSAVARAAGAPSGSMYHRFAGRAALCAELWMRTEERFVGGFTAALSAPGDARQRCVAGARFTVAWCRQNPSEAGVLLAGADALGAADWPSAVAARRRRLHRELRRLLKDLHADTDRVNAAVIDIPYAVVRRHLSAGAVIPPSADEIVADCAAALIAD
ncbi:DNA-binding transcriptional regulator, AcrR family [Mycolicibacterium rutilum]|uniref:DNA-binding transcriptional regulator, AcrR family n=1 Tax=Mycolicibacterium rutilum TaxID=370526 RepID=A0A1H6LTI6_MYCRU|nr:TetR/AcrR family transcriptional regulator [Mycolicibacterium rutilum]SEH92039.1 DNA-binding transcriptional regulator, AcrR family [Mycolicibacterium rutilum]